jgi:N-acylneuraminate cytidylyltransferase
MKSLVIIPARAGSKGLPGKNWKFLNGKPLIQYSIEVALELFDNEEICITTDSVEVIELAQTLGLPVPFVRPSELASDTAESQEVILHAIRFWEENYYTPDSVVLLQPTSPFRKSAHIKGALDVFNNSIDMVVGVKETKANPYYILREENEMGFLVPSKIGNFTRRQNCPKVFEINGAVYIINPNSVKNKAMQSFERIIKYQMDEISSHDIDDEIDWFVAEALIKKNQL